MTYQPIIIENSLDSDLGDDPRNTKWLKINANFADLYGGAAGTGSSYTYATLPAASTHTGYTLYTSDQGPVYSNGTYWVGATGNLFPPELSALTPRFL